MLDRCRYQGKSVAERELREPEAFIRGAELTGAGVTETVRRLADLSGIFADERSRKDADQQQVVYTVRAQEPVPAGTEGGLFFGVSLLEPGLVGEEFFMTKGHFHEVQNRGEYYWGLRGKGCLVLFDNKQSWAESVQPGSLHYVPGHTGHRLVNVGDGPLAVGACWPSDAGHEYGVIETGGFPLLVLKGEGGPRIVENPAFRW